MDLRKIDDTETCRTKLQSFLRQQGYSEQWCDKYAGIVRPKTALIIQDEATYLPPMSTLFSLWPEEVVSPSVCTLPKNVAVTINFMNRLKFTYVPAVLALIKNYWLDPQCSL